MAANEPQVLNTEEFIDLSEYQFSGNNETVERKWCFIKWLRRKASVYHAAQAAKIGRVTAYRWYGGDTEFAKAWDNALRDAEDIMETSIYEDALAGNPILKIFWTKAHLPKYRDKVSVDVQMIDEEIQERMRLLNPVHSTLLLPEVESLPLPHPSDQNQKE